MVPGLMRNFFLYMLGAAVLAAYTVKKKPELLSPVFESIEAQQNRLKYRQYFLDAERINQLPTGLLERVAQQESAFLTDVISGKRKSSAGAVGIMQIVPKWHPGIDATNPVTSIYYAGKYLRSLYNQLGDWKKALAAYNWGIANVKKNGLNNLPAETRNYIAKITSDIPL